MRRRQWRHGDRRARATHPARSGITTIGGLGFKALATTSLGLANIHGRGYVSAEEIIENARMIAAATDLPTNGDLENCGADEPEEAARLIPRALRGRTRRRLDRGFHR